MVIGLSSFIDLRKEGLYIDKTEILDELTPLIQSSTSLIINRPRRFGKSLMVSMIEAFYSFDSDSKQYFDGLKISFSPNYAHINQYPVIKISFKNVSSADPSSMVDDIKGVLSAIFSSWEKRLSSVCSKEEKAFFQSILRKTASDVDYAVSLNVLCGIIKRVYGKKAILLIDEYDAPIEASFGTESYTKVLSFLKSLYIATFKDTDAFGFGFITGVFGIAKGTLGTGLNNIPVDSGQASILSKNYFGFSEEEVSNLATTYHLQEEERINLRKYYGGYEFLGDYFYNPWSILNYLATRSYSSFWGNSGSNKALSKILQSSTLDIDALLLLMREGIDASLDFTCSYEDVHSGDDGILLYLCLAGYLTMHPSGFNRYHVYLPNEETKDAFSKEIINRYQDKAGLKKAGALRKAIESGDGQGLSVLLKEFILSSMSYYDFSDEKNYQIMVGTLAALIFDDCIVRFEVISGTGRCDIEISPLDKNHFGAVIEIKYIPTRTSATRLQEKATSALRQIQKRDYLKNLEQRGAKPLYAYGIAFYKNAVAIECEKIA